ncbi:YraN family protein [Paenibacillus sp. FA6]|uniref:YraN family protein n=1 Tax=Paenibacillus sp. FA6 TaxID=3413029 RepID=UPI003F656397
MDIEGGKKDTRKQKGVVAEEHAAIYLAQHGYEIIDRNWRCRSGEIDIVARTDECLVFVEVRSRSGSPRYGTPAESVNVRKMNQVRKTAEVYLLYKQIDIASIMMRFDVVAVILNADLTVSSLEHITDAF